MTDYVPRGTRKPEPKPVIQPQKQTFTVRARAAHSHRWGVVIFQHRHKKTKKARKAASPAVGSAPNTPPTRKEYDEAKKRILTLHKALLKHAHVPYHEMKVCDMLSLMTQLMNEQRVLSMMYEDIIRHNVTLSTGNPMSTSGNNDPRRPAVGAGPAVPMYNTRASTVRERVKQMENDRHETLLPYEDSIGPGTPINSMLNQTDKASMSAHINVNDLTVKTDNAIRQAMAVTAVKDKFDSTRDSISTTKDGAKAFEKFDQLDTQTRIAAQAAVIELTTAASVAAATSDPLAMTGSGSSFSIPTSISVVGIGVVGDAKQVAAQR